MNNLLSLLTKAKITISIGAVFLLILPISTVSQTNGRITGRVIDSSTGEAMVGVNVVIREAGLYTITDMNGGYILNGVVPGRHEVQFIMPGYQPVRETIIVNNGTSNLNISLSYMTVGELVVTGKRVDNTEAALLSKRKNAAVAQDAISAEQISKSPDGDAADVAKRVIGVTIVDGNTVFVRGLGERYSSVVFSGSTISSPNPEKRIVPLDIFPSSLLDNMIVIKTYSPEMSGEFAGGIVQINPKDYPDKRIVKASVGTSIHSNTSINLFGFSTPGDDFYSYKGGKYDFLGYDDGGRQLPSDVTDESLRNYDSDLKERIGEKLDTTYNPDKRDPYIPLSVAFTVGDSYSLGSKTLGILVSGQFKESSKNKKMRYNRYLTDGEYDRWYDIHQSTYSTSTGALFSAGLAGQSNKFRFTSCYSHQSEDTAAFYEGYNSDTLKSGDSSTRNEQKYLLQFTEQTLWFNQLSSEHYIYNGIRAYLKGAFSFAERVEPDTRRATLVDSRNDGTYEVKGVEDLTHSFLSHQDFVYEISPAISVPFKQWNGLDSKITIGSGYTYRERNADSRFFSWLPTENALSDGTGHDNPTGDIGSYFDDSSVAGQYSDDGYYYLEEKSSSNGSYEGDLTIAAGFAQFDMPLYHNVRFLGGVRYEYADMNLLYYDSQESMMTDLESEPLEQHNIMPAANLTFGLTKNSNIRLAASKTVARPDFREVTPAEYPSLVDNEKIVGNPDLKQTDIYNADLRLEYFPGTTEIIAISVFYKKMYNPIEVVMRSKGGDAVRYEYKNAEEADNTGIEFELRKGLGMFHDSISDFMVTANASYIYSEIKVKDTDLVDYTNNERPLQGQSPYVLNLGVNYDNKRSGSSLGLLYNIYGRRIVRVGTTLNFSATDLNGDSYDYSLAEGDVYEEPIGKLDFVFKQNIGKHGSLKFTAANLLDPEINQTQEKQNKSVDSETGRMSGGKTVKHTLLSYREGRTFSLSLGYSF
ncbi:MAG: carboxypeptidase regulatory-like domain-containing protein [Spirochaetes bacterium]|nr:carboxypeptidase regulatory-like domain-containing protein [Spirochaetota bacterium]